MGIDCKGYIYITIQYLCSLPQLVGALFTMRTSLLPTDEGVAVYIQVSHPGSSGDDYTQLHKVHSKS